jgi:hypothetical protein
MNLWEKQWFINLITFCRKWTWFDKYIYGNSISMEDFVRNPADVFNRTFCVKNVKPLSLINFRMYFVSGDKWTGFNLNLLAPWVTKFSNAFMWFQISLCMKWWMPIPCIMVHFRPTYHWYFQGAIGIAPQDYPDGHFDGVMYAKFRFVNDKNSNEIIWNPTDQVGWNEGSV